MCVCHTLLRKYCVTVLLYMRRCQGWDSQISGVVGWADMQMEWDGLGFAEMGGVVIKALQCWLIWLSYISVGPVATLSLLLCRMVLMV